MKFITDSPIDNRLEEALATREGSGLFSLTLHAGGLDLRRLPPLSPPYAYWARPAEDHHLLGLGNAWSLETGGGARFRRLRQAWDHGLKDWQRRVQGTGLGARLLCGFAFDPDDPMRGRWSGLPNSLLWIPELLLERRGGDTAITFSARPGVGGEDTLKRWRALFAELRRSFSLALPASRRNPLRRLAEHPDEHRWKVLIPHATRDIGEGRLIKVVIGRRIRVRGRHPFDPSRVSAELHGLYPSCTQISLAFGSRTLHAATPERLLSVRGGQVCVDALAGSAPRASEVAEDSALGSDLSRDEKNLREHRLVVERAADALGTLCSQVEYPPRPALMKLRSVQHLHTPLTGRLKPGVSALQLLEGLHPTPAVAGTPSELARDWLRIHGDDHRGWYTGAFGWLDPEGDAGLDVVLRCALVEGREADLYAGAGIVAGSQPEQELQETELKLRSVWEALERSQVPGR